MEVHQLRYVCAIADTGNFSRAAERCQVAQPSLSQQVQKLEEDLGAKLFDRLGRSVCLTDAGRASCSSRPRDSGAGPRLFEMSCAMDV
jgi:LysR family transcriptional regulator, hydrogen peroxide-inducible genes activator